MSESTTLGSTASEVAKRAGSARPTATDIADDVRSGRRTAVDAVTDSLARIREYDDDVAAFQVVRRERALAEAAEDRKSTRLNSSHIQKSRMPSSA